jgi:hypothetical protein
MPTAILAASYRNSDIFAFNGGCANLGSISYLHFENTGAVYFGVGDNSNLTFEHNLVTNLPSGLNNITTETGLWFDGTLSTTLKNVLIRYNTFGDDQSCTAVFAAIKDEGGYCAGVITSQGEDQNLTVEYNNFIHVEQGITTCRATVTFRAVSSLLRSPPSQVPGPRQPRAACPVAVQRTLILAAGCLDRAAEIEPARCKPVHNLPKLPSIRITETTSFARCLSPSFTATYTFIRPPIKL